MILRLLLLAFLAGGLQVQTFELSVRNQANVGGAVQWELWITHTGGPNLYLAGSDVVLIFDHTRFNNPNYEIISQGIPHTLDAQVVRDSIAYLLYDPPWITSQTMFDSEIIDVTKTYWATVRITGLIGSSPVVLRWHSFTDIWCFDPVSPWSTRRINGTYIFVEEIPADPIGVFVIVQ